MTLSALCFWGGCAGPQPHECVGLSGSGRRGRRRRHAPLQRRGANVPQPAGGMSAGCGTGALLEAAGARPGEASRLPGWRNDAPNGRKWQAVWGWEAKVGAARRAGDAHAFECGPSAGQTKGTEGDRCWNAPLVNGGKGAADVPWTPVGDLLGFVNEQHDLPFTPELGPPCHGVPKAGYGLLGTRTNGHAESASTSCRQLAGSHPNVLDARPWPHGGSEPGDKAWCGLACAAQNPVGKAE